MYNAYQSWFEVCAYTAALFLPTPTYQQCWTAMCEHSPLYGNDPSNPLRGIAGC